MKTRLMAVLAAVLVLSACSMLQSEDTRLQLVTQYATLKLIDQSSDITAERVVAGVAKARAVVESNGAITITELAAQVRAVLDFDSLDAADQMLLGMLLAEAEQEIAKRVGEGVLSAETRVAVLTLLDWIEFAALMA